MSRRGATAAVLVVAALMLLPAQAGAIAFLQRGHPGRLAARRWLPSGNSTAARLTSRSPTRARTTSRSCSATGSASSLPRLRSRSAMRPAPSSSVPSTATPSPTWRWPASATTTSRSASADGTGAFTGTGTVATGNGSDPRVIAAGDFNGDAHTDLISANHHQHGFDLARGRAWARSRPTPARGRLRHKLAPAANPVAIVPSRTPTLTTIRPGRDHRQPDQRPGPGPEGGRGRRLQRQAHHIHRHVLGDESGSERGGRRQLEPDGEHRSRTSWSRISGTVSRVPPPGSGSSAGRLPVGPLCRPGPIRLAWPSATSTAMATRTASAPTRAPPAPP